jgi:release factor glutamine methyltransferase
MSKNEKVWTVLSMLEWATDYFKKKEVPDPRLSIEWLLADTLEVKRLDLYLKFDRPLTKSELDVLRNKIQRRSLHEPLQYITGYTDFHGCRICVNPSVLIPRPETEQLVDIILTDQKKRIEQELDILDIGTGSGCIPVALARAAPSWNFIAIDNSEEAIAIARKNASLNRAEIRFIREDIYNLQNHNAFIDKSFDLIISNPPYIQVEEKSTIEKQVLDFEPATALFHPDPIQIYDKISEFALQKLNESGTLYLECNNKLTGQIANNLESEFADVNILKDYDKNPRFIKAVKNS